MIGIERKRPLPFDNELQDGCGHLFHDLSINIHNMGARYRTCFTIYDMGCKSKRDLSPSVGAQFIAHVSWPLHILHKILSKPVSHFRSDILGRMVVLSPSGKEHDWGSCGKVRSGKSTLDMRGKLYE